MGGCSQSLNVGLVDAETILDRGRAQAAKRFRQVGLADGRAPEAESPRSFASARVKVDPFRREAEKSTDPVSYVVNR